MNTTRIPLIEKVTPRVCLQEARNLARQHGATIEAQERYPAPYGFEVFAYRWFSEPGHEVAYWALAGGTDFVVFSPPRLWSTYIYDTLARITPLESLL